MSQSQICPSEIAGTVSPCLPGAACGEGCLPRQLERFVGGESDLARDPKFRHDLRNLLDEAEGKGLAAFIEFRDDQAFQIRRASIYYSSKVFEYPAALEALHGFPGMPDTNILIDVAEALIAALREPCMQAR